MHSWQLHVPGSGPVTVLLTHRKITQDNLRCNTCTGSYFKNSRMYIAAVIGTIKVISIIDQKFQVTV